MKDGAITSDSEDDFEWIECEEKVHHDKIIPPHSHSTSRRKDDPKVQISRKGSLEPNRVLRSELKIPHLNDAAHINFHHFIRHPGSQKNDAGRKARSTDSNVNHSFCESASENSARCCGLYRWGWTKINMWFGHPSLREGGLYTSGVMSS